MKKKEPLEKCANGCDRPPCPPSLVICKECQDVITHTLMSILEGMETRETSATGKAK